MLSTADTIAAISIVSRAFSGRDHAAHERLVGPADLRVDHVEVPAAEREVLRSTVVRRRSGFCSVACAMRRSW